MTRIAYYLIDGRISKEDGVRDAVEDDVEGSHAREDVFKLEDDDRISKEDEARDATDDDVEGSDANTREDVLKLKVKYYSM